MDNTVKRLKLMLAVRRVWPMFKLYPGEKLSEARVEEIARELMDQIELAGLRLEVDNG